METCQDKYKKLVQLLTAWTRAEILARLKPLPQVDGIDYFRIHLEKEDEVRQMLFGSSCLYELGVKFDLVKPILPKGTRNGKVKIKKSAATNTRGLFESNSSSKPVRRVRYVKRWKRRS